MRRERFHSVVQNSMPLGISENWRQDLSGLWQYYDAEGVKRAYVSQSGFAGWFRAYVTGDLLPYDALTLEGIKSIVEGVVMEQDRLAWERDQAQRAVRKAGRR